MSFLNLTSILTSVSFSLKYMSLKKSIHEGKKRGIYQMTTTIRTNNFNSFHPERFILKSFNSPRNPSRQPPREHESKGKIYPSANAGHPHPESNFDEVLYNGVPHAAQSNTPCPLKCSYSPVPALSVPFCLRIRN